MGLNTFLLFCEMLFAKLRDLYSNPSLLHVLTEAPDLLVFKPTTSVFLCIQKIGVTGNYAIFSFYFAFVLLILLIWF